MTSPNPMVVGVDAVQPSLSRSMFDRLPAVYQQQGAELARELGAEVLRGDVGRGGEYVLGAGGDSVQLLQGLLAQARHDPGPADGDFGERTQGAVRAFQRARRLTVDGVVGPQTLQELAAPFLRRFLGGLEDAFDPVIDVLDNLAGHFDIDTAPEPVLRWWAWLMGAELVEPWPESRQREHIRSALALHRMRGTALGIRQLVAAFTGLHADEISVVEGGDTSWSSDPDSSFSASSSTHVTVSWRSDATAISAADLANLRQRLLASLPVGYSLEVLVEQ